MVLLSSLRKQLPSSVSQWLTNHWMCLTNAMILGLCICLFARLFPIQICSAARFTFKHTLYSLIMDWDMFLQNRCASTCPVKEGCQVFFWRSEMPFYLMLPDSYGVYCMRSNYSWTKLLRIRSLSAYGIMNG